jgi:AraC-like DNA-binding protein
VFLYHWSDGIRLIEGRRARAKFGWCAVPSADGRTPGTARIGGVSWVVPKNTRNPAAALRMLRRLIEPSFAKRMEIDFGWPFPALRSLYDDERVLRARPYYAEADALLERGKLPEEAEYLYGGPQPWETTGGDAVTEALSSLGQGHDLEEVLTRLEALLNPLLPTPSFGGLAGRAAALIEQNLRDRLTGAAIAQKLGVTRAHLSRVFHENTGQTLHDFVEAARIAKAKELLRYTNRRIGEVALELGFKSIHHFSRVFSARVGASPRAFRNSV